MTALHDRSQKYYLALNEAERAMDAAAANRRDRASTRYPPDTNGRAGKSRETLVNGSTERNVMTITVGQFGVAEEDIDGGSTPPITDCLVLDEYLGQQIAEIRSQLEGIRSYVWHAEANYDMAEKYCLAAVAAIKDGPEDAAGFFVNAVADVFHFDRALRASVVHKTPKPLRRSEIPKTLKKRDVRTARDLEYELKVCKFYWSDTVPNEAALKAAEVMTANAPDAFWIAEYERPSVRYDPIIYASYGTWQVEVARW
jgi:hypothetical protein